LECERGLSDARLAREQHHRSRHESAAEHAVELADAGGETRHRVGVDLGEPALLRAVRFAREQLAGLGRGDRALFDQRRPGAALGAAPKPARLLGPALGARVDGAAPPHRLGT
jgi:hypothetical protein